MYCEFDDFFALPLVHLVEIAVEKTFKSKKKKKNRREGGRGVKQNYIFGKRKENLIYLPQSVPRPKYRRFQSPATRSALSLSLLVFLHRLLSRFFTTLRSNLLLPTARTFRKRHPKATRLLTSSLAPALGASLAGIALAVHPADETRSGIAVWVAAKAVEYAFNVAEARGLLGERPWVCDS